jgi:pilus assembly protein CpaB
MRVSSLITLLLAVLLAGVAGFMAQRWLEHQRRMGASGGQPNAAQTTVVIATRPLRFGTPLNETNLREMDWPSGQVPDGAFRKLGDLLKPGERRIALAAIEPNELILGWKITGPGQRPSLSALLAEGMKAVTIRVNDVHGVAGFVLPNDRVDVMLTRKSAEGGPRSELVNEVLLQGVKVLAIDQLADDRLDKATVAKAVTIEVNTEDAQRVVLASTVGTLSLALRGAGSDKQVETGRITPMDLTRSGPPPKEEVVEQVAPVPQVTPEPLPATRTFGVTRSTQRTEYSIPEPGPERPANGVARPKRLTVPDSSEAPVPPDNSGQVNRPAAKDTKVVQPTPRPLQNSWSIETIPAPPTPR